MADKPFHELMADKLAGMGSDDESADDYDGDGDGYKAAVSSFIEAVHAKDVDAASEALEHAIALCKGDDSSPDMPHDEDGETPPEHGGHAALLLIPHGGGH